MTEAAARTSYPLYVQEHCAFLGALGALPGITGRVREPSDSRALGPYLETLERMRLIRIVKSMDASPKERDRRYSVI